MKNDLEKLLGLEDTIPIIHNNDPRLELIEKISQLISQFESPDLSDQERGKLQQLITEKTAVLHHGLDIEFVDDVKK